MDRYGVYIHHLTTLCQDTSIKGDDRARLKGYLRQWQHSKILVGCAMFIDAMKPASLLSLTLQELNTDIVLCIEQILKAFKYLTNLQAKDPLEWPSVKLVKERMKVVSEESQYQGVKLMLYNQITLENCKKDVLNDLQRLIVKLKERLEWSDTQLLRSFLVFSDTKNWIHRLSEGNDDVSMGEVVNAVEYITGIFRSPLEAKGMCLSSIQDEIEEVIEFSRKYLPISTSNYRIIWFKLHTCSDSDKWPNLLILSELIFSLPFSNSHVEQIFSSLGIIKTKRRTNLSTSTLQDLLEIFVEGPPVTTFDSGPAVELWWRECHTTRRVNQKPRKTYRSRKKNSVSEDDLSDGESSSDEEEFSLEQWDKWFGPVTIEDDDDNLLDDLDTIPESD